MENGENMPTKSATQRTTQCMILCAVAPSLNKKYGTHVRIEESFKIVIM